MSKTGAYGHRIRVLIVDDCIFLRTAVAGLLGVDDKIELAGQASNGAQGLHFAKLLQPDVVVTDLAMPVMDGAEFIQQQLKTRYVPIIIFSALGFQSDLAVRACQAGAVAHVTKPVSAAGVMVQHELLRKEILGSALLYA